jgi:hypothetical protein
MTKTLTECYEKFKGQCGDGDKGTYHSYIDINDRTFIYSGDATTEIFYNLICEHSFKIIIDDGSHKLNDQVSSFRLLRNLLGNKGLYFIEDVIPENVIKIQEIFGNCFKVLDLRHERTAHDNIIMIYENF